MQQPNFFGALEDVAAAAELAHAAGRAPRRRRRPGVAGRPRGPRAAGRRHRRRRGPGARQRHELRRPRARLHGGHAAAHAPHPRAPRRRDRGRGGQARLRAHAADARAAHPPRAGDQQHLLQPRAQRARGARAPLLARAARDWASWRRCARARPPTCGSACSALPGVAAFTEGPVFREFAVRLPVPAARARRGARARGLPRRRARGAVRRRSTPASKAWTASCCWPSRRSAAGPRSTRSSAAVAGASSARRRPTVADRGPPHHLREVVRRPAGLQPAGDRRARDAARRADPGGRCAARRRRACRRSSEVDLMRHFTGLSSLNFGVDSGSYPLGSCTMKYNPQDQRDDRRASRASPACTRISRSRSPRARSS